MIVFRLAREPFAHTLSGKGAAMRGARWNSPGVELIYTAENRSLAMAEVAVHLTLATLPTDFRMISIEIPDDIAIQTIPVEVLPADWNIFPHPASTQKTGDKFVAEGLCAVLKIPSVVTDGDYNYLLNPLHPDFGRIKIVEVKKFAFDGRVFQFS
jgi:RES domain-containing protein